MKSDEISTPYCACCWVVFFHMYSKLKSTVKIALLFSIQQQRLDVFKNFYLLTACFGRSSDVFLHAKKRQNSKLNLHGCKV